MEVAYVSAIPIVEVLRLLCKSNVEALRKCATDGELSARVNAVSLPFIYLAAQMHSVPIPLVARFPSVFRFFLPLGGWCLTVVFAAISFEWHPAALIFFNSGRPY